MIVDEASKVTLERGSKKVEAYHLCVLNELHPYRRSQLPAYSKHAVETVETLDFLKEIVAAVPDPSAGGTVDLNAEAQEKSAAKKRSKGKKTELGEDGEPKAPVRKRKRKDEADGEVKERGRGRGKAKAKQQEEAMEEDKPVSRDEDDDYENGDTYGGETQPRTQEDDEDWEG